MKSFKIATLLILVSTLSFGSAFAQNGKALSLQECIQIALKNNSDFKNAAYQVDRVGADVTASYSTILPRIGSSFQMDRSTVGSSTNLRNIPQVTEVTLLDVNNQPVALSVPLIDPATGQQVVQRVESTSRTQSFNNHTFSISYNQTLWDFGRSIQTIKQAKAGFEASSQNLTAARQAVYSTVNQRYLELLKAIKLEQEFQEAVERSKEQLRRTQSMYEIGSVALIDVYRQEVILGTDEVSLINQRNAVLIAKGNLNVTLGQDPEEPIDIMEVEISAEPPTFTLDEAIATAGQNNPDLRRFEYEMKSAEHGRKSAKARFLPAIGVGAVYSRDNEQFNRVYGNFSENYFINVGATLDFNIFNGFSDRAEVSRQTANYSIARESHLNRQRTLRLQVKQAYLNLKAYQEITVINERNLRSAEEDNRLAQERYRVGAGTQLEVTDAQVSLTRARVNLVNVRYDALIAQAQLQAAMGTIENAN
ncbi:MAG TPA: TolC family protein [bacterium]